MIPIESMSIFFAAVDPGSWKYYIWKGNISVSDFKLIQAMSPITYLIV